MTLNVRDLHGATFIKIIATEILNVQRHIARCHWWFDGTCWGFLLTFLGQWLLAGREHRHALRMAALEVRIATHQQAFCYLQRLASSLNDRTERSKILQEAQQWLLEHSLYLTAPARDLFYKVCRQTLSFDILEPRHRKEVMTLLIKAIEAIERGVELPPTADVAKDVSAS
ncbi:MAG: hypothetical protein NTV22_01455 [bacterium]|nr:hypothetical protein [bacterium]